MLADDSLTIESIARSRRLGHRACFELVSVIQPMCVVVVLRVHELPATRARECAQSPDSQSSQYGASASLPKSQS